MSLLVIAFIFIMVALLIYLLGDIFLNTDKYKKGFIRRRLDKFINWIDAFVKDSDWSNPNVTNV